MRYLIDFYNTATDAEISQYLTDNGCTVIKEWDNFEKEFLVECNSALSKTAIVEHLADDSDVFAIKPMDNTVINYNYAKSLVPGMDTVTIDTSSQDDWWKNYVLENPVFDQPTTTISRKGGTIPVYVMDSGIKADHPEFVGVSISNIYSIFPGDFSDTGGHGTAMASVISGRTAGITDCPLKIVKIFGNVNGTKHNTLQSEFIDACDAILNDFTRGSLAVLNCSFVMARNLYIENKMRQLNDAGIFIVCAAGNNGTSIEDLTPACMPEAMTIGAFDQNLEPCDFSNYTGSLSTTTDVVNHGELDVWAPGQDIRIAGIFADAYQMSAGTSIATAIASAVLAYDLHDMVDPVTKQRLAGLYTMPFLGDGHFNGTYASMMQRREGLLDLSNPKYANSKNLIVTISQGADNAPEVTSGITDYIKWVVKVGENYAGPNLTQRYKTQSIEMITPLPPGFSVMPNSQLAINPGPEVGPDDGELYKLYNIKYVCNYLDGTNEEKTLDLYVTGANFDTQSVPEDHPLNIVQSGTCNGLSQYCGPTIATNCLDLCGIYCCNTAYKGSPCQCA